MTSTERDFDRIARAWLDLGPNEAPDRAVDAVLQAIETTPQVRRSLRWPTWRSTTMTRITMLAVLAGTIAIVLAGLALTAGGPAPAPIAVVPGEPSPSAGFSLRPGEAGAPIPDVVKGGWSGPSRGTAFESTAVTTIVLGGSSVDSSAPAFSMDYPGMPSRKLGSNLVEVEPGVLRFILSTPGSSDCDLRADGRYRWSLSPDGQWLTLELVSEECPVRGEILAGTWQRNVAFSFGGGPGIATNFQPYIAVTLPAETWTGVEFADTDTVHTNSERRGFKVWKDLDGFVDPCDRSKGRLLIDAGMDAFLAYLREDPRFTVTRDVEIQIDGHRAVDLAFQLGKGLDEPCWDFDGDPTNKTGVLLWAPQAELNPDFFWNGELDGSGTLVVTEVDGVTVVFESVNADRGPASADREVLDTVRFLDALPTPPPS